MNEEQSLKIKKAIAANPELYGKGTSLRVAKEIKFIESGMAASAKEEASRAKAGKLEKESTRLADIAKVSAERAEAASRAAADFAKEARASTLASEKLRQAAAELDAEADSEKLKRKAD